MMVLTGMMKIRDERRFYMNNRTDNDIDLFMPFANNIVCYFLMVFALIAILIIIMLPFTPTPSYELHESIVKTDSRPARMSIYKLLSSVWISFVVLVWFIFATSIYEQPANFHWEIIESFEH